MPSDSDEFLFFATPKPNRNVCNSSTSLVFPESYQPSKVIQLQLDKFFPLKSKKASKNKVFFKDFRSKILASFKKSIRCILNRKHLENSNEQNELEMICLIKENSEFFSDFCYSSSQVFPSHKKSETHFEKTVSKTYSNTEITKILKFNEIRRALQHFYNYKFKDNNIPLLKKKLKITCCHLDAHHPKCYKKWEDLKGILLEKLI